MKLQKDQKILIHGGAGGIGALAIQLAKHLGAFVATTVATEDKDFAKELGADQVIDYKTEKFEDIIKDFDAVFVTNPQVLNSSVDILKEGGTLVSMVGAPDEAKTKEKRITVIAQMTKSTTQQLNRLSELVDGGIIKPEVAKVFPLEEAQAAFEMFETEHPRGKIVVKIK
jgi:NADPH:quinone reductase-like Zn-dependent oxidoreductase